MTKRKERRKKQKYDTSLLIKKMEREKKAKQRKQRKDETKRAGERTENIKKNRQGHGRGTFAVHLLSEAFPLQSPVAAAATSWCAHACLHFKTYCMNAHQYARDFMIVETKKKILDFRKKTERTSVPLSARNTQNT